MPVTCPPHHQPLPGLYQSAGVHYQQPNEAHQPKPEGVYQPQPAGVYQTQLTAVHHPQPTGVHQPQPAGVHQTMSLENRNPTAISNNGMLIKLLLDCS